MIYVTGDIHGCHDCCKLSNSAWKEQTGLTRDDYLIICGDFGLPFLDVDIKKHEKGFGNEYSYWAKWLSKKPYTILFVDGNHENFNFWDSQPIERWHGGRIQRHPHIKNVIHLMRGEVYDIDGKTFLTFGGAVSIDKAYRKENVTWWRQEDATIDDLARAYVTLKKHNNKVDYVITHTIPERYISKIDGLKSTFFDKTAMFLDDIYARIEFKRWYAGHFHIDSVVKTMQGKPIEIVYNSIKKIM